VAKGASLPWSPFSENPDEKVGVRVCVVVGVRMCVLRVCFACVFCVGVVCVQIYIICTHTHHALYMYICR
jgi:hypothetical protein